MVSPTSEPLSNAPGAFDPTPEGAAAVPPAAGPPAHAGARDGAQEPIAPEPGRPRPRLATVWLAGCSGCHMSFLDLDEWLFELAAQADVVYSPIASDCKLFPDAVDVCLVEGAVANAENLAMAHRLRRCSRLVVSFGDCAISGNVPAMRNRLHDPDAVLQRAYVDLADAGAQWPGGDGLVPELLPEVLPLHAVIPVDVFLPGCPPSAARIQTCLQALLRGERPLLQGPDQLRFG